MVEVSGNSGELPNEAASGLSDRLGGSWWTVRFKGGDEDRPHPEMMGVQAPDEASARKEALRQMREDFGIRYPEIYSISKNEW